MFDAVTAVTFLVGVPAAALHPEPAVIAVATAATLLLAGRLLLERTQVKRAAK